LIETSLGDLPLTYNEGSFARNLTAFFADGRFNPENTMKNR